MMNITGAYLNAGKNSSRKGNDHPNISPYGVFKLKSNRFIALGVGTELQFERLAQHILKLAMDENYNSKFKTNILRIENREELRSIIQNCFNSINDEILLEMFNEYDIPHSLVNTMDDVFKEDHIKAIKLVEEVKTKNYDKLQYVRHPVTYSKIQCEELKSPPLLGEHTREVLKNILNYSDDKIDELFKNNIIH